MIEEAKLFRQTTDEGVFKNITMFVKHSGDGPPSARFVGHTFLIGRQQTPAGIAEVRVPFDFGITACSVEDAFDAFDKEADRATEEELKRRQEQERNIVLPDGIPKGGIPGMPPFSPFQK